MTAESLRQARDANPFIPYSLRLSDGSIYMVPHPDYVSVSPNGELAALAMPNAWRVEDVSALTKLEFDTSVLSSKK